MLVCVSVRVSVLGYVCAYDRHCRRILPALWECLCELSHCLLFLSLYFSITLHRHITCHVPRTHKHTQLSCQKLILIYTHIAQHIHTFIALGRYKRQPQSQHIDKSAFRSRRMKHLYKYTHNYPNTNTSFAIVTAIRTHTNGHRHTHGA